MTAEVSAACESCLQAGAEEVWVKDAHDSARNILAAQLPPQTRLLRGWSGHPYQMMEGLDGSFQAALLVGYHSRAGSNASPLAHTMSGSDVYIKINDRFASEFLLTVYTAALSNVPVIFVSGDAGLCEEAAELIPAITTVAVKQGTGEATNNLHPRVAVEKIKAGVAQALAGDVNRCRVELPRHFSVEIRYKNHTRAYANSFFPGAFLKDPYALGFESPDYFEVLRLIAFVL
jgi:D-amino peptidase